MDHVLDWTKPHEKYFEKICSYPHGSYNEKPLSDYLVSFAKMHNLRYEQYENGNVIIYKEGSRGYETHPPVMIQAHIDMVCEKDPAYDINFELNPISIYVKDGFIRARGTSLGGDDGVGVAYMLALLSSSQLRHPPLECVFTVQEEVTMGGAKSLNMTDIHARRMISLDEVSGNATTTCGAGGWRLKSKIRKIKHTANSPCYSLKISGLRGGHSGDDIHLERGNAIQLLSFILYGLNTSGFKVEIASIHGGTKMNSIPRECVATFSSSSSLQQLYQRLDVILSDIREELKYSDPDVTAEIKPTATQPVMTVQDSTDIISFLYLLPCGLCHRSMNIKGLTTASNNIAIIETQGDEITVSCMARGARNSFGERISNQIRILSKHFGWSVELVSRSSCWPYKDNSAMRQVLQEAFRDVTGRDLILHAEHGGLECGVISEKCPEMDIVTLGPKIRGYHTSDENVDRTSFEGIYNVLVNFLARL